MDMQQRDCRKSDVDDKAIQRFGSTFRESPNSLEDGTENETNENEDEVAQTPFYELL